MTEAPRLGGASVTGRLVQRDLSCRSPGGQGAPVVARAPRLASRAARLHAHAPGALIKFEQCGCLMAALRPDCDVKPRRLLRLDDVRDGRAFVGVIGR